MPVVSVPEPSGDGCSDGCMEGYSDGCTFDEEVAGYRYIFIEYGAMILDIRLRVRIHLLEKEILAQDIIGLQETAPGVRSLQIRYDPLILPLGCSTR